MNRFITFSLLFTLPLFTFSQTNIGGLPLSFYPEFQSQFSSEIHTISLKKPLRNKDKTDIPTRNFTLPLSTDIQLQRDGKWTSLSNGNRLWHIQLNVEGAEGLVLLYDQFHLPAGSKLFVYSADRQQVLGAYTSQNNSDSKRFLTGIIKGESAVIEYYEPVSVKGKGSFKIFRVDYIYPSLNEKFSDYPFQQMSSTELGFGASNECEVDVNCVEKDMDKMKRSTCRIMMVLEEGIGWCTGNLMNNTANDGKPLTLTAYHCYSGFNPMFDLWRFDFNYEHNDCNSTSQEPDFQSILGCQLRSFWEDGDMLLVEMNQNIPSSYNAYFSGWDNSSEIPNNVSFIHHPRADVKKVSLDKDRPIVYPISISWNNDLVTPANHHLRVTFNEGGGFQGGSSGGALFDQNQRIVGQLHGGFPDSLCRASTAYFGRLFMAWEGGGTLQSSLQEWLNPIGSTVQRIDGIENPITEEFVSVQGKITTPSGSGIAMVDIKMDETIVTKTDLAGNYFIENMKVGTNYNIQPYKNIAPENGTSVRDLIDIQKHILSREPFTSIYQLIAADVDNSSRISVFDLIQLQKVILSRSDSFPGNTSWRFVPNSFKVEDIGLENFDFVFPENYLLQTSSTNADLNFVGVKIGDVNETADSSQ